MAGRNNAVETIDDRLTIEVSLLVIPGNTGSEVVENSLVVFSRVVAAVEVSMRSGRDENAEVIAIDIFVVVAKVV